MPTIRRLIIDRSKWLRMEGADNTSLYRPEDGKMCCLGMLALRCGAKEDDIKNLLTPDQVPIDWPDGLIRKRDRKPTALCMAIMEINDEWDKAESQEKALEKEFARLGIELRYTN
jgi:hypothetical protein